MTNKNNKDYNERLNAKINDYVKSQDQASLNDRINKGRDKSALVNSALESYAEAYKTRKLDYQDQKAQEEKQIAASSYEKAKEIQQGIEQLMKLAIVFFVFYIVCLITMLILHIQQKK